MSDRHNVPVNIAAKLELIDEYWAPKIVGRINDLDVKAVKVLGEFTWHTHDDTDELFWVQRGSLTIQFRDRDDATINEGEFFVAPRGVEHCPRADAECHIVLLEPTGTVNTGDSPGALTATDEWI